MTRPDILRIVPPLHCESRPWWLARRPRPSHVPANLTVFSKQECRFDGGHLRVGPHRSGPIPRPVFTCVSGCSGPRRFDASCSTVSINRFCQVQLALTKPDSSTALSANRGGFTAGPKARVSPKPKHEADTFSPFHDPLADFSTQKTLVFVHAATR